MLTALSSVIPRRRIAVPWLLLGGYTVATLDMLVAITYWSGRGVSASHVLQVPATWILGHAAYSGGMATAMIGALVYGHLMWGVVALYRAIARHHPVFWRRPFVCGSLYGVAAYFVIFQIMAPLLTSTRPNFHNLPWQLICVATFMTLVGIPCALFSRMAGDRPAQDASPRGDCALTAQ